MNKKEDLKKIMTNDLIEYLVEEKIIDGTNYLISDDAYLTSYENIEDITIHMVIKVNYIVYLVEKTIIKQDTSKNTLNIYEIYDARTCDTIKYKEKESEKV